MFSLCKKAALIGLGLSERLEERLTELAKKGEESQNEGALRVKAFFESGEKRERAMKETADKLCKRLSNKIPLPTRDDFSRLEKEISALADRLRQSEERSQQEKSASSR